ncbi:MAG: hypothetical protein ACTSR3_16655 [Candidatus Helarchaeota archaeon]
MVELNVTYFMMGTIIFLTVKTVNVFFDWENPPTRGVWMVVDLFFGAIFLMAGLNGMFNYTIAKSLPIIFVLFTALVLISRSLIEPNTNFLIILFICTCSYFGFSYLFFIILTSPSLIMENIGSNGFIAVGTSLGISLAIGIGLFILFKKKWPERQETLWQATKFWECINNKSLLVAVLLLMAIEAAFQLRSQSIIFYFFRL